MNHIGFSVGIVLAFPLAIAAAITATPRNHLTHKREALYTAVSALAFVELLTTAFLPASPLTTGIKTGIITSSAFTSLFLDGPALLADNLSHHLQKEITYLGPTNHLSSSWASEATRHFFIAIEYITSIFIGILFSYYRFPIPGCYLGAITASVIYLVGAIPISAIYLGNSPLH